jgi:hypothetical protein
MKATLWLVVVVLGVWATGCTPGSTAAGSALVHSKFPYAVTYDDQPSKSVLGADWGLENYRHKNPDPKYPGKVEIQRKDGYQATYRFDFNDDDKMDATEKFPNPDLLLVSKKTAARIEVTSLLLDDRLADKELRVLLNDAVESASGTLPSFLGFGDVAVARTKRVASRLVDSQEVTLGGEKGLVATIDRANVDQLELDRNARWRRYRLFLMRAPFDYYATVSAYNAADPRRFRRYRVLLVVEYSNAPEDFEAQYPDFVRLMNKLHFMGDQMLMAYIAEQLASCSSDKTKTAALTVDISGDGKPEVRAAINIPRPCAKGVVSPYRFPATGQSRALSSTYDFSKVLKPAWLDQGGYVEHRQVTAPSVAPSLPVVAGETPPKQPDAAPQAPSNNTAPAAAEPASSVPSVAPGPSPAAAKPTN